MNNRLLHHIKNLLLPCLAFSVTAGFLSAILVTAFKLAAEGGFLVSAVYQNGEFAAEIESRLGGELRVIFENANGDIAFADRDGKAVLTTKDGDAYCITTQKGMQIYACSANGVQIALAHDTTRTTDVKMLWDAKLGTQKEL